MSAATEDFEQLAEDVSVKAARIEASSEEYIDGLETIIGQLQIDIQAHKEAAEQDREALDDDL